MRPLEGAGADNGWSSNGMTPTEAVRRWQTWASEALAPMHIEIADETRFTASWRSHAVGPVQLVALEAGPQRVVHRSDASSSRRGSTFQLVFCRRTPVLTRVGADQFLLDVGECVLLDNARSYEMSMDCDHEAIDLIMPGSWLERWLPDPAQYVARPISASANWGLPLGSFISTMAGDIEHAPLPRAVIADQVGPLLALAVGHLPSTATGHKTKLVQRLERLVEERHGDPELSPADVASALGISRRYLHAVLAEAGATFVGTLSRIRLDRAADLLADRRFAQRQVAEIAWQCGYLDPSYFARVFRRRFGMGPRDWRNARQP